MFIEDLIIKLSNIIENKINQSILMAFQEYLLKAGIFIYTCIPDSSNYYNGLYRIHNSIFNSFNSVVI